MSKFDFGRQAVTAERKAKFVMYSVDLGGNIPYLIGRPAGEINKPYFNELLKRSGKTARQVQAGQINPGMIAENREGDKKLFATYVVTNWGYIDIEGQEHDGVMPSAEGADTKFSAEEAQAFFEAMPSHIFDEVRGFFTTMANFAIDDFDPDIAAKN